MQSITTAHVIYYLYSPISNNILIINGSRCNHALEAALLEVRVLAMLTSLVVSIHSRYLDVPRSRTVPLSRSFNFVPACAQYMEFFG